MLTGGWISHEIACLEGGREAEPQGRDGAIAQLGERLLCKQEVVGSIPSGSTRPAARHRRSDERPNERKSISSAAYRSGLLDIVKKGYA